MRTGESSMSDRLVDGVVGVLNFGSRMRDGVHEIAANVRRHKARALGVLATTVALVGVPIAASANEGDGVPADPETSASDITIQPTPEAQINPAPVQTTPEASAPVVAVTAPRPAANTELPVSSPSPATVEDVFNGTGPSTEVVDTTEQQSSAGEVDRIDDNSADETGVDPNPNPDTDTDGDGVPDSEDAAPTDPSVQTTEQLAANAAANAKNDYPVNGEEVAVGNQTFTSNGDGTYVGKDGKTYTRNSEGSFVEKNVDKDGNTISGSVTVIDKDGKGAQVELALNKKCGYTGPNPDGFTKDGGEIVCDTNPTPNPDPGPEPEPQQKQDKLRVFTNNITVRHSAATPELAETGLEAGKIAGIAGLLAAVGGAAIATSRLGQRGAFGGLRRGRRPSRKGSSTEIASTTDATSAMAATEAATSVTETTNVRSEKRAKLGAAMTRRIFGFTNGVRDWINPAAKFNRMTIEQIERIFAQAA